MRWLGPVFFRILHALGIDLDFLMWVAFGLVGNFFIGYIVSVIKAGVEKFRKKKMCNDSPSDTVEDMAAVEMERRFSSARGNGDTVEMEKCINEAELNMYNAKKKHDMVRYHFWRICLENMRSSQQE